MEPFEGKTTKFVRDHDHGKKKDKEKKKENHKTFFFLASGLYLGAVCWNCNLNLKSRRHRIPGMLFQLNNLRADS